MTVGVGARLGASWPTAPRTSAELTQFSVRCGTMEWESGQLCVSGGVGWGAEAGKELSPRSELT